MMTRRVTWLAGLALTAALAAAGCSSAASTVPAAGPAGQASADSAQNPNLDLGTSLGGDLAPDFTLDNQFGQPVKLSQYRGHPVVLSFEDPECSDICPLTTQSMVLAKELLGKAGDPVQLLGVDANPGAPKVADVLAYSRAHGLTNQWNYLAGPVPQLKSVWADYHVTVQVTDGDVIHTPAVYIIDAQGRMQKLYLSQMAYSSVTQEAQVMAAELARLLPGHPKLTSLQSLGAVAAQTPAATVSLPAAAVAASGAGGTSGTGGAGGTVKLGPGQPRLVAFFATWLTETSDLKAELATLNAYAKAAPARHLPALTAVDEEVTEASKATAAGYLSRLGPLAYPIALDQTGRLADGYGVQDQPWLALVNATGKIVWQHDGWVSLADLQKAAAAHS
jgi:cytochrome oxidase Cu insertion factor (SCO1/SenC/PrrC family)